MARTGSELEDQVESLNFLLRQQVGTPSAVERAAPGPGVLAAALPTAALLRSYADGTLNGNPTESDF